MADPRTNKNADTEPLPSAETLPLGAREVHLDLAVVSDELAERLSEAGASDKAIDAAGGEGAAKRLRAAHEAVTVERVPAAHGRAAPI